MDDTLSCFDIPFGSNMILMKTMKNNDKLQKYLNINTLMILCL
jgi:hypothetical protein